MRIVACITQTSVINQILTHLRTRTARAPAQPPTPRRPPEDAPPDAPRPRGDVRRARSPHRRVRWGPADGCHPPGTATRTTRQAPARDGSHDAARHAALARSAILAVSDRVKFPTQ